MTATFGPYRVISTDHGFAVLDDRTATVYSHASWWTFEHAANSALWAWNRIAKEDA